jgi:23S rRNA (uridine2552-2'-O)-methyltransferase
MVHFMKMDFLAPDAQDVLLSYLQSKVDVVMSDMAANTTGHKETDHIRIMNLCRQAFEFAKKILKPGGHFIAKIFMGGAEKDLLQEMKVSFTKVQHFKPKSSRKESTELYVIATSFKQH